MSLLLVKAGIAPISEGLKELTYIDDGRNVITPFVDGKPKEITVELNASNGESIAKKFNDQLAERNNSGVVAWIDFDHEEKASAGQPKSFRYERGKGIVMAFEFSKAGEKAVKGKDYSYFSPTFLIGKDGQPLGLPAQGPWGGLVNEPAFRNMGAIAAKSGESPHQHTMSELVNCGLLTADEAARENANSLASQRVAAMKGDISKLDESQTELEALRKENAKMKEAMEAMKAEAKKKIEASAASKVEDLIKAGHIGAADEDMKIEARKRIIDGDAGFIKVLEARTSDKSHLTGEKATASNGKESQSFEELVTAQKAKDGGSYAEAFEVAAASHPAAYEAYNDKINA